MLKTKRTILKSTQYIYIENSYLKALKDKHYNNKHKVAL